MSGVYIGVDGVAKKVKDIYIGVNGVARKVKKAYIGVNGVAKECYSSGKKLNSCAVGDIVQLTENGVNVEYIVIHQGLPSSMYDASCNGTWLLRKDGLSTYRTWHNSKINNYEKSSINTYLNNTFFKTLGEFEQSAIKQVKIPYRKGSGTDTTVTSGASGLSTKVFLLSSTELSFNHTYMPQNEGAELSYFKGCSDTGTDNKRVCKVGSSNYYWWTRSPYCSTNYGEAEAIVVGITGGYSDHLCDDTNGVRPALIMNSDTLLDPETNLIMR